MSTSTLPVPYQIETYGGSTRHNEARLAPGAAPRRNGAFLVQLMSDGDPDIRRVIGRRDVARARLGAYSAALVNRPSCTVAAGAAGIDARA